MIKNRILVIVYLALFAPAVFANRCRDLFQTLVVHGAPVNGVTSLRIIDHLFGSDADGKEHTFSFREQGEHVKETYRFTLTDGTTDTHHRPQAKVELLAVNDQPVRSWRSPTGKLLLPSLEKSEVFWEGADLIFKAPRYRMFIYIRSSLGAQSKQYLQAAAKFTGIDGYAPGYLVIERDHGDENSVVPIRLEN